MPTIEDHLEARNWAIRNHLEGAHDMTEFEEWIEELKHGPTPWYERIRWPFAVGGGFLVAFWVLVVFGPGAMFG